MIIHLGTKVSGTSQDIFISYNRKDKSFAEFLVKCLEGAGLKCFQDVTGLKLFDKLDASLKLEIARSKWLMSIISPSYLQSYWCLFEALEAIQGQDVELRFFPIVLRYSPDDQALDETFVMKALADLDEQIRDFERQMVQLKAYELSAKLDKLNFVRANLPKIFRTVGERIFPEFLAWDDAIVRDTLRQLITRISPEAKIEFDTIPLAFDRLAATPLVIPRLRELPSLLWKQRIGCQAWKNSPLVVGNHVLVGSAGSIWNEPDSDDGIYSLDAETGNLAWFAPTPADANRLLFSKGIVVTGCDDGSVVAVTAKDGKRLWHVRLDSGVVGGPIKLSANIGGPAAMGKKEDDPLLVITYTGSLYLLDLWTGRELGRIALNRFVLAEPLLYKSGYSDILAVPTADETLVFVNYSNIRLSMNVFNSIDLRYPSQYANEGFQPARLTVQPVFADGLILQGIARDTSYSEAPIIAIDDNTKRLRWMGTDSRENAGDFGNLRSAPIVVDREIIFAAAYTNELCALSLDDGRMLWAVDLGQGMFEQWCGPVAGEHTIYIGRHDGYIHKVDTKRKCREWSIFLGASELAGTVLSSNQKAPEFDAAYSWNAGGSSPILATPVLDRGRLYVGTQEGYLYCVANLGED